MYWLDTTLLTVLGLGAGLGFLSGFLWQVGRILSLILSLAATVLFNEAATALLSEHVLREAEPRFAKAAAYVVVFLFVYIASYYTTRLLHEWVKRSELRGLDRLCGAVLGAAKSGLLIGVFCLAAANYPHPSTKQWMAKSSLAPMFADGMEHVIVVIPEEYKDNLRTTLGGLRDLLTRPQPDAAPQDDNKAPEKRLQDWDV